MTIKINLKICIKTIKLNKNDIVTLDRLRDKVISGYTRGDITKDQYDILLNNVSVRYNEIFENEINLLKNEIDNENKIKLINELQSKIDAAYLKENIY